MRHVDLAEGRMRYDDGIPITGSDTSEQPLPVLFGEVRLVGYQDVCVRVELVKLVFPLIQQVIRYDDHGLGKKAHAL